MLSKTFAIVVGTAGYLLGGRADRDHFDRIKEQAIHLWNDDPADRDAAAPGPRT